MALHNKTPTPLTYYKSAKVNRGFLLYEINPVFDVYQVCVGHEVSLLEFGKHYTDRIVIGLGDFQTLLNEGKMVPFTPNVY